MINRRVFLTGSMASGAAVSGPWTHRSLASDENVLAAEIEAPESGEDVFDYIRRVKGEFDPVLYSQIRGAANEFKEGDLAIGVAALHASSRHHARELLGNTQLHDIDRHATHRDGVYRAGVAVLNRENTNDSTLSDLRDTLLASGEHAIHDLIPTLSSDVIGCVCKLMTNAELIQVGSKVFHPLPGTNVGAEGYLGARIQPNSPTDNVDDIRWQVFDGWSYAVGDVLLQIERINLGLREYSPD